MIYLLIAAFLCMYSIVPVCTFGAASSSLESLTGHKKRRKKRKKWVWKTAFVESGYDGLFFCRMQKLFEQTSKRRCEKFSEQIVAELCAACAASAVTAPTRLYALRALCRIAERGLADDVESIYTFLETRKKTLEPNFWENETIDGVWRINRAFKKRRKKLHTV